MKLDLKKTYAAILNAARKREFISYGELAEANGVNWNGVRHQMPRHLDQLVSISHQRGWPLITAIVVAQGDLTSGELRGQSLDGFIKAAKMMDYEVTEPVDFLREQQGKVFAWAPAAPDSLDLSLPENAKESVTGPRFVSYFGPLLDALRAMKGEASAKDVYEWIRTNIVVPEAEIIGLNKGGQSKFENKVGWARFYLSKAGLVTSSKRGIWTLTSEGREKNLDMAQALKIFKAVQEQVKVGGDEDDQPPEIITTAELFEDPERQFWFGGAAWDNEDQLDRFIKEGIWENGYGEDRYADLVDEMRPGDRIAIKSSFTQKHDLPFDIGGKKVSCMRIKAVGTVVSNMGDHKTVKVDWDSSFTTKDWYFYTYLTTLVKANREDDLAKRLILFAFAGENQDCDFWLQQPYFARKYRETAPADAPIDDPVDVLPQSFSIKTIIEEGCFLAEQELQAALTRLKEKKNLILQGPPGTGKTWLAKRLGYALIGSKEAKVVRSRLRVVQFHPSLSYEDFVRGWRPTSGGGLQLIDGVFLASVQAALSEPDIPHVFIIEEINRGNPAQVFGEMLTLLEDSKRRPDEGLELAYRREKEDDRVHIPPNLYIIGTMNIADRSLALVDLALRRRFSFVTLKPQFGKPWREWCLNKAGFDDKTTTMIEERLGVLNKVIGEERTLGPQFSIGHSYLTPQENVKIPDPVAWYKQVVKSEIAPLLDEYWFDATEKAQDAVSRLLADL